MLLPFFFLFRRIFATVDKAVRKLISKKKSKQANNEQIKLLSNSPNPRHRLFR